MTFNVVFFELSPSSVFVQPLPRTRHELLTNAGYLNGYIRLKRNDVTVKAVNRRRCYEAQLHLCPV